MAAGQGFKTFATGDVLSAADVNGYLMQGVLVFADSAERDAEITSPEEGQFAYLKDTNVTTYYTGSVWANLDTTGMTNPMTTTGDVIYSSSGSTPARLGLGTAGQVLQVNSGATAPEWATAASGGAFTLLSTTTLNSSNQVISGIDQSYKHLFVTIQGMTNATGNGGLRIDCNSNASSAYYSLIGGDNATARTAAAQGGQIEGTSANVILRTSANNAWTAWFYNYTEAAIHPFNVIFTYQNDTSNYTYSTMSGHIQFGTPAAISSIRFNNYGGAFNGGTVKIYGVN